MQQNANNAPQADLQTQIDNLSMDTWHFYKPDPISHSVAQTWFFADILPWQVQTWQYMTTHFPNLPHAMLFAGNAGTGKRAFVYRFIAWALCQDKTTNHQGIATACGHCESCQWLIANTHPSIYRLPKFIDNGNDETSKKKSNKSSTKTATKQKLIDEAPTHEQSAVIKIDDIRQVQPFVQQSSDGVRFVIIHQSEAMTLGASNALLKTLEEPADNVLICLITDTPSQLLPTIRSRLQSFSVSQMSAQQSLDYMKQQLPNANILDLQQVNNLSGFSPLVAMDMLHTNWYHHRQTWITSLQAIRSTQRSPLQASDYWQKTLTLADFLYLSKFMLTEITQHLAFGKGNMSDIDLQKLEPMPTTIKILQLQQIIDDIWQDRRQHIQDKLCYDKLMFAMQTL